MNLDTMNIPLIALGLAAANFCLTWGVMLYMYLSNKNKATNERINKLEADVDGKLDSHADRLARLEQAGEASISHADLSEVYRAINLLSEKLNHLLGVSQGQGDTLRLILARIAERGMP